MAFGQAKAISRFTTGFLRIDPRLATVNAFEQIRPLNPIQTRGGGGGGGASGARANLEDL